MALKEDVFKQLHDLIAASQNGRADRASSLARRIMKEGEQRVALNWINERLLALSPQDQSLNGALSDLVWACEGTLASRAHAMSRLLETSAFKGRADHVEIIAEALGDKAFKEIATQALPRACQKEEQIEALEELLLRGADPNGSKRLGDPIRVAALFDQTLAGARLHEFGLDWTIFGQLRDSGLLQSGFRRADASFQGQSIARFESERLSQAPRARARKGSRRV